MYNKRNKVLKVFLPFDLKEGKILLMRKDVVLLTLISVFSTLVLWAPFLLRVNSFWGLNFQSQSLDVVYKNYDGPMYLTVAKSFYLPEAINEHNTTSLHPIYFAAHFPLYPVFIRLADFWLGSLKSMVFVTLVFSILSVLMFYKLVFDFSLTKNPFFLSLLFMFLPARWLIVRSVGANEPVFAFFLLASFYFFKKAINGNNLRNFFLAGITGALAQLTRSPGIILLLGYLFYLVWKRKITLSSLFIFLIPLSLLVLFFFYSLQYKDFLAYFHSGDNIHLEMLPFGVFNSDKPWVGTHWLEDNIYIYLIGAIGIITLLRKRYFDFFAFASIYFAATLFVAHRDIARYSLPIVPFVLIAFEDYLTRKEFKIALVFILVPIYLFAWNFLLHNQAPIADWGPYL